MKEYQLTIPNAENIIKSNSIKNLSNITSISNSSLYRIKTYPQKYINKTRKHKYKDYVLKEIITNDNIKKKINKTKINKKTPILPQNRTDNISVSFSNIILSFD